ncbi:hypothetical protein HG436_003110 [Candidatus Saccharibacteria bacterium]|nr:hypothetical protein [Candidatus Saccharibacteria bacterium]
MNRQTPERPRTKENPPQNTSVTSHGKDETLRRVVVTRSECDENGDPNKREERERQRGPGLPREVGRIACSESGVVAEPEPPVEDHNSEAAVSDDDEAQDVYSGTGAAREDDAAAIESFRENIGKEIEAIDNSLDMITESTSNSMAIMRRIQEMIQSFARYSAIRGVPSSLQSEKQHLEELRFRAQQLSADEGGRTARRELDASGESLENEARRTGSRDRDVKSSLLFHGLNTLCYSIDYNDAYRYLSALKAVEEQLNTAYRTGASIDDRVGEVRNYTRQIAERFSVAEFSE